jgi:hypothetical protein
MSEMIVVMIYQKALSRAPQRPLISQSACIDKIKVGISGRKYGLLILMQKSHSTVNWLRLRSLRVLRGQFERGSSQTLIFFLKRNGWWLVDESMNSFYA